MQVGDTYIEKAQPWFWWTLVEPVRKGEQWRVQFGGTGIEPKNQPNNFQTSSIERWVDTQQWLLATPLLKRLLCLP